MWIIEGGSGESGNVFNVSFKLWGAAGGTNAGSDGRAGNLGGHGGFVSGKVNLAPGTGLLLQVGQGGSNGRSGDDNPAYPKGGIIRRNEAHSQGGGGRSAIFIRNAIHGCALAIAGGGGGQGNPGAGSCGGSGGAGLSGAGEDGRGAQQVGGGGGLFAGGRSIDGQGAPLGGGNQHRRAGPGGGDGFFGGGAGQLHFGGGAGAGGGSNITLRGSPLDVISTGNSSHITADAPHSDDPDYVAGIARASAGGDGTRGGNGLIVLVINGVKTVYRYTGRDIHIIV